MFVELVHQSSCPAPDKIFSLYNNLLRQEGLKVSARFFLSNISRGRVLDLHRNLEESVFLISV